MLYYERSERRWCRMQIDIITIQRLHHSTTSTNYSWLSHDTNHNNKIIATQFTPHPTRTHGPTFDQIERCTQSSLSLATKLCKILSTNNNETEMKRGEEKQNKNKMRSGRLSPVICATLNRAVVCRLKCVHTVYKSESLFSAIYLARTFQFGFISILFFSIPFSLSLACTTM